MYHVPVLLNEVLEGLNIRSDGIYVDATYGGGGHSKAILEKITTGKIIAFDQDENAKQNLPEDDRIIFIQNNFRYMKNFLRYLGIQKVHGIMADLGVSSHQFDTMERGFSFRNDITLDMRMNRKASFDAQQLVNNYDEENLTRIFFEYGEIRNARCLARAICLARSNLVIHTVNELIRAIERCIPVYDYNKYLAKVFQAIRIEVNDELGCLKDFLKQSLECLAPGGRLVILSYHSLEDRMVKNFIKTGNVEGKLEKDLYGNILSPLKIINKNVIIPGEDEIKKNNRARSAKLRIAEKK